MVFGIHSDHLGGGEGKPIKYSYDEELKIIDGYTHPQTWEPPSVSLRVSAQHSQFIYSTVVENQPHGSIALDKAENALFCIKISPELKRECLTILRQTFDISAMTLFPDLEGFGKLFSSQTTEYANERW